MNAEPLTPQSTSPSTSASYSVRGIMGRRVYAERARKLGVRDLGNARQGRTLEVGHSGADVRELQGFLSEEGYDCGQRDGYFGTGTARALSRWQRDAGIRVTGAFDAATKERYLHRAEGLLTGTDPGRTDAVRINGGVAALMVVLGVAVLGWWGSRRR